MASTYFTLLTNIGMAKIANAIALGQDVEWTSMAVGDGNGNPTTPNPAQTTLVREKYRATLNQLDTDPDNPTYIVAEMIIPTNVGGWAVNEVGIIDADGDLVAVANFPATYKPLLEEGSGRDLVIRIVVQVSNTSVVQLKVDPAITLASQAWVIANFVKHATVVGGTTGQVLAKKSNADEDFQWVDPTAAVNVIVDAKPERQTLASGQTIVTLAVLTTTALAVYIEGVRLIETIDYTVNSNTQFTLARSYPAGSRIHMYQNDPTSIIADATDTVRGFVTLNQVRDATPGRLIGVRVFSTAGTTTYTPTPGTKSVVVEVQGGGAAGGGTPVTGASQVAVAGGGGAGGYAASYLTSGFSGVTVTVGAGGVPSVAANGGGGGASSFGALLSATGGGGGPGGGAAVAAPWLTGGGTGGSGSGGNIVNKVGGQGGSSFALNSGGAVQGGGGGFSHMGGTGGAVSAGNASGNSASAWGSGGGGVSMGQGQASVQGGAGFRGIVIVWEYA